MIATINEFLRTRGVPTIKCTTQAGMNVSASHCTAPGDDSPPVTTDYAALVAAGGTGTYNAVGYVDKVNEGIAAPGEKRLYGRDSDSVIVNVLHMFADGSVRVSNENGYIELAADGAVNISGGDVNINGAIIDSSGNISSPGTISAPAIEGDSVKAGGKELAIHTHPVTSAPGTTGPNT